MDAMSWLVVVGGIAVIGFFLITDEDDDNDTPYSAG
jgi:hypothetical protein